MTFVNLEMNNVGKIGHANIKLDGITVVAGENNTGKSTIGKMLFCVFHAFYKIEEQIREERVKSISRVLNSYYHEAANRAARRINLQGFAMHIVENRDLFLTDTGALTKEIKEFFISKDTNFEQYIDKESLEKLTDRICVYLKLEEDEIQKIILRKRLEAEFAMKVGHLNNIENKASVKLEIKDDNIAFDVIKNEKIEIVNYMNLTKEIIYMDDPFVLDDLERLQWRILFNEYEHRQDLLAKLMNDKKTEEFSVIDEIVVQQKLERIFEKMQGVCQRRYRLLYPGERKAAGYGGYLSLHGGRHHHGPGDAEGGAAQALFLLCWGFHILCLRAHRYCECSVQ